MLKNILCNQWWQNTDTLLCKNVLNIVIKHASSLLSHGASVSLLAERAHRSKLNKGDMRICWRYQRNRKHMLEFVRCLGFNRSYWETEQIFIEQKCDHCLKCLIHQTQAFMGFESDKVRWLSVLVDSNLTFCAELAWSKCFHLHIDYAMPHLSQGIELKMLWVSENIQKVVFRIQTAESTFLKCTYWLQQIPTNLHPYRCTNKCSRVIQQLIKVVLTWCW